MHLLQGPSPSWHLTRCHSPLPWPSTICKEVLPGQCQRYPLYWHHCSVQPQHGGEGQRDRGCGPFCLLEAGWGMTGRAQHPLLTDARHPWEPAPTAPSTLGSEVGLAQHLIPICSAAPGGGAGLSLRVRGPPTSSWPPTGSWPAPMLLGAEPLSLGPILHVQDAGGSGNVHGHGRRGVLGDQQWHQVPRVGKRVQGAGIGQGSLQDLSLC